MKRIWALLIAGGLAVGGCGGNNAEQRHANAYGRGYGVAGINGTERSLGQTTEPIDAPTSIPPPAVAAPPPIPLAPPGAPPVSR